MRILTKNPSKEQALSFLQFFNCLAACDGKGISVNQEIIYNIIKANQSISKNIFIPCKT